MWIENVPVVQATAVVTETAPNTLSQLVYLSYKNHGRFLLDLLQWQIRDQLRAHEEVKWKEVAVAAREPLDMYAEALDKDDTDVELWRSSAVVAQLVGCNRIARFCLEAVLDMGEESLDDILGLPNVDQTLALSKLQEMAMSLQDDLSKGLAPLSTKRRQKLGEALVRRLESHAVVPKPGFVETAYSELGQSGRTPIRYVMRAPKRDWTAVGETIIQDQVRLESGTVDAGPGVGIGIYFPESEAEEEVPAPMLSLAERPMSAIMSGQLAIETTINDTSGDTQATIENGATEVLATGESLQAQQPEATRAPSRKRSPDSAELPEDDGRGRKKRTRVRGEGLEANKPDEAKINADWQLGVYRDSDGWLYDATNTFLNKLGLPELISAPDLRALVNGETSGKLTGDEKLQAVIKDVYDLTTSCPPEMVGILQNGLNNENFDSFSAASREAGISAFLGTSSARGSQACVKPVLGAAEGLQTWVDEINASWYYPKEAACKFLFALLKPGAFPDSEVESPSSYVSHRWPDDLKRCVVQLAVRFDDEVYQAVEVDIETLVVRELKFRANGFNFMPSPQDLKRTS